MVQAHIEFGGPNILTVNGTAIDDKDIVFNPHWQRFESHNMMAAGVGVEGETYHALTCEWSMEKGYATVYAGHYDGDPEQEADENMRLCYVEWTPGSLRSPFGVILNLDGEIND